MAEHNPGRTTGDGPATTLVPAEVLRFGLPGDRGAGCAGATSAAVAFEEAYARVKAVGAATTEHMNALADLAAAGIAPGQLRVLAGVMSASPEELRRRLNPSLGRGKHPGLIAAIDAADEED